MNKIELIEKVAEAARITKKDAAVAVDAVFDVVLEALVAGEAVKIAGFGSFEVKERAAREGMNPMTKEPIHIPAQKAIGFRAAKPAKEQINK